MISAQAGVLTVAAERLEGVRCLVCTGPTGSRDDEVVCLDCGASFSVAASGVIEATPLSVAFGHELDREIDSLVPVLERLEPPACTERAIAAYAKVAGVEIGNPVWEGRADIARLMDGADGVVLDIGAGFGTIAVGLARSAAHVFALDRSAGRARVTAARARAEGLTNVTAIHADGSTLPLGSETCDLVLLIGVLEWTGYGHDDPLASQEAVLAEASRVLKWGGTLLIGIENRFGAHYFLGRREEHTRLRFSSLLPRALADVYGRLAQGRRLTTYTHSRRALLQLVRRAGLEPRVGIAVPTYSEPQLSFDRDDLDRAWRFYLRHIYRYRSTRRRLVGLVGRLVPPRLFAPIAPTFWVAAGKGPDPAPIPTVVTGSGDAAGDIKVVDWDARQILRFPRNSGELSGCVDLLEGWSARNWVCSPLLRRTRLRRQQEVLRQATALVAARERAPITDEVRRSSLGVARAGLEQIDGELPPATREWCEAQLSFLAACDLEMVREHTDFAAVNLVVETPGLRLRDVDRHSGEPFGIAGIDAVILATDVLCTTGCVGPRDLDAALTEALEVRAPIATALGRLLWADFGAATPVSTAVAMTVAAVLRYTTTNGRLPGIVSFLHRSARGELEDALRRLGPAELAG